METTMKIRHLLMAGGIAGLIMAIPVLIGLYLTSIDTSGNWGYALCCLGPLWVLAGGLFSAWLYRRFSKSMTIKIGIFVGGMSGLIAGIVSLAPIIILLSYLAYSFGQGSAQGMAEVISQVWAMGEEGGTWFYLLGATLGYVLAWIVFGILGGLLGAIVFREKKTTPIVNP
jgi:hypothetical protein